MGTLYIAKTLFFTHNLKQLFKGYKAITIRFNAKFIRLVAEDIDQKAAQTFCFDLITSFAQKRSLALNAKPDGSRPALIWMVPQKSGYLRDHHH